MGDVVAALFDISFEMFGFRFDLGDLGKTIIDLCSWDKIIETDLWAIAEKLNTAIVPLGLSLLTLFFLIDLMKKMTEVERISWERVAFSIIRFLIFKMLITNSYELLSTIMSISGDWVSTVVSHVGELASSPDLKEMIADLIYDDHNLLEELMMSACVLLLYLPMMGTIVGVIVQVFVRIAKLILSFSFAPIPLAVGTWEDGSATGKKFIMSNVALGLEALLIVACAYIYSMGLGSLSDANSISTIIGIMVINGFFLFIISILSGLSEKWVGGQ